MSNLFNSSFEVSLRMLIILNTVQTKLSIERITALDFISIYGKDFGVSEYNLQGDNDYRFGEYSSRREIASKALKELVLRGFIVPHCDKKGFLYSISKNGCLFCESLNDKYATDYANIVKNANLYFYKYSDRKLICCINKYAIAILGERKI